MSFKDLLSRVSNPKVKIVVGVVGLVGAGIYACVKATKYKEVVKEERRTFKDIHDVHQSNKHPEEIENKELVPQEISKYYTDKDYAKDVIRTSLRYTLKTVSHFGGPILVAVASTVLIFNGASILNKQLVATTAALSSAASEFKAYRQRVGDRFGQEVEDELYLGIRKGVIKEKYTDEEGNEQTVEKEVYICNPKDPLLPSGYAFWFDETCGEYCPNAQQREWLAGAFQDNLNAELQNGKRKFVTLCELYDIFRRPKNEYTPDTLILGWVYDPSDPSKDNYINLRVERVYVPNEKGSYDIKTLIDPNIDGKSIYDCLVKRLKYDGSSVQKL